MKKEYTNLSYLERRLVTLYGLNSKAIKALDLLISEMCVEKGFVRDDGSDYYTHCVDVANTLLSHEIKNEDVICAALLHDIIEDVEGYKEVTIEKLFNARVARLVQLLTKDPSKDYHISANLKEYIAAIQTDADASAIKAADRMHNMMTLERKSFESRYEKAIETEQYYIPFFKYCRQKYTRYENLFYAAKAQTEPLIYNIKAFYKEVERLRKIIADNNLQDPNNIK